jgi:hypothetical protein
LNLRPLRPERGTTVRCRAAEHARGRSEHDSGASGSSSAVRWAWVCSFFVPSPTFSAFAWPVAHQSNKELRAAPSWAGPARLFLRVIGTVDGRQNTTGHAADSAIGRGDQGTPPYSGMAVMDLSKEHTKPSPSRPSQSSRPSSRCRSRHIADATIPWP